MSLSPQVCKKNYKVHIPAMGEECEFWLVRVTDEQSISNPDKDHAYYTDDGKLFIYDGKNLVRVNCDLCFTQDERDKLEGIEEGANKYVLPVANDSSLGGIKTGFTQTEKQYAVEVNEEGQAYVTVPWTDTVYTLPVADTDTLGGVKLGYTQNGKNYPVLKDSEGNIYVAVPWVEYQLQQASAENLGGIKTGYEQQGQNYPVDVDVEGNAYVTVPWSETSYQPATDTTLGLIETGYQSNEDNYAVDLDENGKAFAVVPLDSTVINGKQFVGSSYAGEVSDCGVELKKIVGKTVQNGTPSPDSPVEIENVKIDNIYSFSGNMVDLDRLQSNANVSLTRLNDRTVKLVVDVVRDYPSLAYAINNEELEFLKGKTIKIICDSLTGSSDLKLFQLVCTSPSGKSYINSGQAVNYMQIPENATGLTFQFFVANTGDTDNVAVGDWATFEAPRIVLYDSDDQSWKPYGFSATETNLTLAEGDTYENGKVTRVRKQVTFDGSSDEAWRAITNNRFQITVQDVAGGGYSAPKGLCNRLQAMSAQETGTTNEWGVIACHNTSIYIRVSESVTTVEQLQTWLSTHNLIVEYELETPTTEEFKIPTIESYSPYTVVDTDSEIEPTITFNPIPWNSCLVNNATEQTDGLMSAQDKGRLDDLYEWYQNTIQGSATVLIKRS